MEIKKDVKKIFIAGIAAMALYVILYVLGRYITAFLYQLTGLLSISLDGSTQYKWNISWWSPIDLAGSLVTTLTAFCILITYHKESKLKFVYYLKTIYILLSIASLGSWVTMTILYLNGYWSPSSDVHKFILKSGISPVVIIFAAAIVILLMTFLFLKKRMTVASSDWQKKNVRRMGIWMAGVLLIVIFTVPLYIGLDIRPEIGGSFRITEKDDSPDSILKKQYEIEIEEDGTYVIKMHWGGECSGVITAVNLSLGNENLLYFTAEKIFMETLPQELKSGTYTLSIYCLENKEEWEAFYAMLGEEAGELDYNFHDGKYALWGGYEFVKEK